MVRALRFGIPVTLLVAGIACSGTTADTSSTDATPGDDNLTQQNACSPCVVDTDCGNSECIQDGPDSYCAPLCVGTAKTCGKGRLCKNVATVQGANEDVCVPANNLCGAPVGPGSSGDGTADGGSGADSGAVPGAPPDPGVVKGSVGNEGGTVSKLYFAVIGDTRPPVINDTRAYPSAIISKIYSDVAALNPMPSFAVSSGDYIFSTGNGTQAAPQFDLYLAARAKYPGTLFPALGNHECTGAVTSNCGTGNLNGVTDNYKNFLAKLLAPIGKTNPYYSINVNATDKSWTAKYVFVAANAWDAAQDAWMRATMAQKTTYTFVLRHEPSQASNAPGVKPSEAIMAQFPYTLAIVGHTHTYGKTGARQVTIGNGGAPLTGAASYGYGLVSQRNDGAIQVDMMDYQTGKADLAFRFALKADGSPAP